MTRLNNITTYAKIMLLILLSAVAFIVLFLILFFYTAKQEKEVYNSSIQQFNKEVHSLMVLNSESHISTIIDVTYWNELIKFIGTKNKKWFDDVIASTIDMYKADYLGIYDLNGNYIDHVATNKIKATDFISKDLFPYLYKKKLSNFYIKIPGEGVVEVFAATIHPSDDPLKVKSKPSGYFIMARVLDAEYFNNLEKISSSKIKYLELSPGKETFKDTIHVNYKLKNWDNSVFGELVFKRPFHISFKSTRDILMIFIGVFSIGLFLYMYYLKKWINNPLKLITTFLENGNEKNIKILKKKPGEFGYIGNLFEENINQRKQLEIAKEKAIESDKLKSAFLTNLSHEIRTPMNAIIGFSDLLNSPTLTANEKEEYIKIISQSGINLVSIIDDLIEMSKIDANQITPTLTSVDVDDCILEIFNSIKITIPKEKNIEFNLIPPTEKIPHRIFTDVIKLKQVITNLLTNAIKFTDEGYVTIAYEWNLKKNWIEFTVKDSGLGIEKVNQEFIFERFRRIDGDYSIKAGGLGLGLAISKAYVELLGGTISLKSKLKQGSKFKFTIPIMFDKSVEIVVPKVKTSDDSRSIGLKDKTILIAEDDNINYLLFEKIMQHSHFDVIRAKDGEEAVAIFTQNGKIDLVLMDIKMPKMNGYEALEKIKKKNPSMRVIAQTAYSSSDEIEKIKKAGFDAQITKPIDKEKLFDLIDSMLK